MEMYNSAHEVSHASLFLFHFFLYVESNYMVLFNLLKYLGLFSSNNQVDIKKCGKNL